MRSSQALAIQFLPMCSCTKADVTQSAVPLPGSRHSARKVPTMPFIDGGVSMQVSDKCPPADLVSMIKAFNPDNLPGRLAVVVRMGAAKLRTHMPALIEAVEEARLVRSSCRSRWFMVLLTAWSFNASEWASCVEPMCRNLPCRL